MHAYAQCTHRTPTASAAAAAVAAAAAAVAAAAAAAATHAPVDLELGHQEADALDAPNRAHGARGQADGVAHSRSHLQGAKEGAAGPGRGAGGQSRASHGAAQAGGALPYSCT